MKESHITTWQQIIAAINIIGGDNKSGAAEILGRAAEVFSLLAASQILMNEDCSKEAQGAVIEVCARLVRAQPDMAPLANLANEVLASANKASGVHNVFESAAKAARAFTRAAAQAAGLATSHAASLICDRATILTHSRSSTVVAAFCEARRAGRNFSVIATESRPGFEGRRLAETLAREQASVTLIADAAAALAMDRVDMVLLGADRVTPDFLVNKIGTRMIALAARERGVPVYALCDGSKFTAARETLATSADGRSRDELWPDAPSEVIVLNPYFEPVPLAYFTAIITEEGALEPRQSSLKAQAKSIYRLPPGPPAQFE